jgi:Pregnancy-associated plasma protein-A
MPMKKLIGSVLCFLFSALPLFSQGLRRCAIGEVASSKLRKRHQLLDLKIQEYFRRASVKSILNADLIRLPVVVHVIHNTLSGEIGGPQNGNISLEQIQSQIAVLNEDYRKKTGSLGHNSSPIGADMNIEFYLATIDPNGKPTNGINRVYSSQKTFDVIDDNYLLSGLSYWDSNRYLNIWVTSLLEGYLGVGEFPGGDFDGLESEDVDEKVDGIIIDHTAFGRRLGTSKSGAYSSGRTLTHEIGHWLGLLHTWGDEFCGDDFCDDTPPTERGNLTVVCNPIKSRCKGVVTTNMIENYMDYSADSCMNIFTLDQSQRVRAVLEISKRRKRLIENSKFSLPNAEKLTISTFGNPNFGNQIKLKVLVNGFTDLYFEVYDLVGKKRLENSFFDTPSRVLEIDKDALGGAGVYIIRIFTSTESVTTRIAFL